MAACKVCGAPHKTCGPPSASLIANPITRKSEEANVGLHEYHQNIRGIDTTVLLSDEDAKAAGLTRSDRVKPAPAPEEVSGDLPGSIGEQLTPEEVAAVRELLAARGQEGEQVNTDDEKHDGSTPADNADQGASEKQAKAPANKAVTTPSTKAATPAATK